MFVVTPFWAKYCSVLGQSYFALVYWPCTEYYILHFIVYWPCTEYYILHFTVAVEETSSESVSLTALHEASASRRKVILLSSPSEPVRPTTATADDHFVMFHTAKMDELVGSAACPHCNTAALHVTETYLKGYAVQRHLTCEHCYAELSSVYSSPKLPTCDNPTRQPYMINHRRSCSAGRWHQPDRPC